MLVCNGFTVWDRWRVSWPCCRRWHGGCSRYRRLWGTRDSRDMVGHVTRDSRDTARGGTPRGTKLVVQNRTQQLFTFIMRPWLTLGCRVYLVVLLCIMVSRIVSQKCHNHENNLFFNRLQTLFDYQAKIIAKFIMQSLSIYPPTIAIFFFFLFLMVSWLLITSYLRHPSLRIVLYI